jgi:diadenosine tetraphosphate (Ap4A) HIT family hydrolase
VNPKGAYTDQYDFYKRADDNEIVAFNRAVAQLVEEHKLHKNGYRAICNMGQNGGQEVPHFHMHLLGGTRIGAMVSR